MGIKGLMKLLNDNADGCFKTGQVKNYMGRVIAIDASMQLYQFMSMVRSQQYSGAQLLSNDAGEVTSHILGFFHRTIGLLEKGIKPVYVFDGKPPEMKDHELKKRREKKAEAEREIEELKIKIKEGDKEAEERLIKVEKKVLSVTKKHNEDVMELLKVMGVPYIVAPSEAEAQCATLCKDKLVFATATEDMDALTFGTPILLRNLTYSPSRKLDVIEIHLEKAIHQLGLTQDQFIDLCILCGCDYSPSIRGIGPVTSLKLMKEHKTLEKVLETINREKHPVPKELEDNLDKIRNLFKTPEVEVKENIPKFCWE